MYTQVCIEERLYVLALALKMPNNWEKTQAAHVYGSTALITKKLVILSHSAQVYKIYFGQWHMWMVFMD